MMDASNNFTQTITVTVYDDKVRFEADNGTYFELAGQYEVNVRNRQKVNDWIDDKLQEYERLMAGLR